MDRIGRYQIVGEIGRGAMGVVYHATDPAIGRPVALKIIRVRDIADAQRRDTLRERLFREARSAGVLSHPNIVTIYDMDEVDGLAYIAMAYVNGPTLKKILDSQEALSGTGMLRVLRQTASALDYAHGRGIVHRDIKPANIMTDEDGAVKVTDFGIAKIVTSNNVTDAAGVSGTTDYMSPEQVQGLAVDGRSDQFSLAVIAWEILTGERPFQGSEQLAEAHTSNGTLTPQIDHVLRRALSKKPEARFPNCSHFVGALEMACAESRGWRTISAGPEVIRAAPEPEFFKEPPRRSRFLPVFMTVISVVGIAGVVAWQTGAIQGWLPLGHGQSATAAAAGRPEPQPPPLTPPQPEPPAQPPVAALEKPSPLAPIPEPHETVKVPAAVRADGGRAQDIWVTTNPPGAKAVFDDNVAGGCETPCMLHGPSGVHHLTISKPGYLNEYRELHVGEVAEDVPLISLRQPGGTLMLTTAPPGANIRIDGQLIDQVTPAAITLRPGSYEVTVERGGRVQTQQIELQDSPVYVRIPLGP